tara:strand:+ start:170968 stop:172149 length:1182 start_codon:yes stop_codon:yes gene_type:complete
MRINRLLRALGVLGVSMAACWGTDAGADPFIFQGQLKDAGFPANGTYDINFQLRDSAVGGVLIGAGVDLHDVPVVDGLFTVELDFLVDFDGSDRWIQINVRDGDSVGGYTALSPRQPMRAAPEAQHAKTADALVDPDWFQVGGNLTHGDGNDRVYINRDGPTTFTEYFGVHADTSSYVGMIVSGLEDASPYYGYTEGGQLRTYTYYSSFDNSWNVWHNGAERLILDSSGHLFAQNVNATEYRYTSPKTRYTSVSGNVFSTGTGSYSSSLGQGGAYMTQPGTHVLTAPVSLPDGAIVKNMRVFFDDTAPNDLIINLAYQGHGSGFFTYMSTASSAGLNGNNLEIDGVNHASQSVLTVNHQIRNYHVRAYCFGWPGNTTMRIRSVLIEYTVDEAD